MCFTPIISFLTFAIEMILAVYLVKINPKKSLNRIGAVILFLLGAYQLSEFGICTSSNQFFWARAGHIAYTLLPALGMHWVLIIKKSKKKAWPLYIPPAIFISLATSKTGFIGGTECARYFIKIIYNWNYLWLWSYQAYYAGSIILVAAMLLNCIANENNKKQRTIYLWGLVGVLSFTFPAFFFILLLPSFNAYSPSILCHFALLFAIIVAYMAYLTNRNL